MKGNHLHRQKWKLLSAALTHWFRIHKKEASLPKSIEILRGRFVIPLAGFNQCSPIMGLLQFLLYISSRYKSAESTEPPRHHLKIWPRVSAGAGRWPGHAGQYHWEQTIKINFYGNFGRSRSYQWGTKPLGNKLQGRSHYSRTCFAIKR